MKSNRLAICLAVLLVLAGLSALLSNRKDKEANFSCVASYAKHTTMIDSDLVISYTFGPKMGIAKLNGSVTDKADKTTRAVNRQVVFTYQKENHNYYLDSLRNIKFPRDNIDADRLAKALPLFFVKENEELVVKILPYGTHNYLFFFDPVPSYSCKKM